MSYNIAVGGQHGPQRSKKDILLQKEFGHPSSRHFKNYSGSPIGVLGQYESQRSNMDKKMLNEFGGLNRESFQYRTQRDKLIQKEFNPYYNKSATIREEWRVGHNCGCSTRGCDCHAKGISSSMDDPYNPYSHRATYVPLS